MFARDEKFCQVRVGSLVGSVSPCQTPSVVVQMLCRNGHTPEAMEVDSLICVGDSQDNVVGAGSCLATVMASLASTAHSRLGVHGMPRSLRSRLCWGSSMLCAVSRLDLACEREFRVWGLEGCMKSRADNRSASSHPRHDTTRRRPMIQGPASLPTARRASARPERR